MRSSKGCHNPRALVSLLVRRIDHHHPPGSSGGQHRQPEFIGIALMHSGSGTAHHTAQGLDVFRVLLVQDQGILRAQQLGEQAGRAGVEPRRSHRMIPVIHRCNGGMIVSQQGVRIGKGAQHALRCLAGALGIGAAKVIKSAAGVRVDQGQRRLLLLQGAHQGDQQAVLHDIGAIAGMEGVAIIHSVSKP